MMVSQFLFVELVYYPTLGLLWAPTSNHLSLLEAWKLTQFNFRLLSIFLLDSEKIGQPFDCSNYWPVHLDVVLVDKH